MASQISLVLVATASGHHLASELSSTGQYRTLAEGPDGVPKALLGFNGMPVLNHWLMAIQQCPRLLPLHEKVFILCNDSNAQEIDAWARDPALSAGGFPAQNILSLGAPDSRGLVADVAAFVAAVGPLPGALAVAEADALLAPEANLAKAVEHAMIRAKDSVLYSILPKGADLEGECLLLLEEPGTASSRIAGADTSPAPGSTSNGTAAALAPMVVLRPETLAGLPDAVASSPPELSGLPPAQQLGGLISALVNAGTPVYASPIDCCFRLGRLSGLSAASHFFSYYLREVTGVKGEAAKALEAARKLALINEARTRAGNSLAGAVRLLQEEGQLGKGGAQQQERASVRDMYTTFFAGYLRGERQFESEKSGVQRSALYGVAPVSGTMPLRFADVTTRTHRARGQHPMYMTTNNDYGIKPASQLDMPNVYVSSSQAFTNAFPSRAQKSSALLTAVTHSKVHKLLDDY